LPLVAIRALVVSAVACVVLVLAVAGFTQLSFERAAVLAPVLVVSVGAIAFLIVLWGKVAYESLRGRTDRD
jgi:hypothetical protein